MNQYEIDYQQGYDTANDKWLDRIKQARKEIKQNAYPIVHGVNNHDVGMTLNGILQVLDKLIAESED
jgi:hypothetical protein